MANTYVKIGSTVTVGTLGASSIDFTSIPSTYTDLVIKLSGRTLEAYYYGSFQIRFNSSTTTYTGKDLYGIAASGVGSASRTTTYYNLDGATATASTFASVEIYIPNYASSNYKSFSMDAAAEDNSNNNNESLVAGLWSTSTAISSISIVPTNNFVQYSTASLYGISKS